MTKAAQALRRERMVQCWYEFASPYSYLAVFNAEETVQNARLLLEWRPFLLAPSLPAWERYDSPLNPYAANGHYLWRDMERLCGLAGLGFNRPSQFPRDGLLASRIAVRFRDQPWLRDFVRAIYVANFVHDLDISQRAVVLEALNDCGVNAEAAISQAETPGNKLRLRQQTDEARRLGVFGAPTFVVGSEVFYGNDRLSQAIDWAMGIRLPAPTSESRPR